MDKNIITSNELENLVEHDKNEHILKHIAILFLSAMNDWPTINQTQITDFIYEFKDYYGMPLTLENIEMVSNNNTNDQNAWRNEAGSSIAEAIKLSISFCNESNIDKIIDNILTYYNDLQTKLT